MFNINLFENTKIYTLSSLYSIANVFEVLKRSFFLTEKNMRHEKNTKRERERRERESNKILINQLNNSKLTLTLIICSKFNTFVFSYIRSEQDKHLSRRVSYSRTGKKFQGNFRDFPKKKTKHKKNYKFPGQYRNLSENLHFLTTWNIFFK